MLDTTTNLQITKVLGKFDEALQAEDAEAAAEVFQDDCYWRDLVSFAWNIKTMEGKAQVREMLEKQLAHIKPSNWEIAEGEPASEEDGVITA